MSVPPPIEITKSPDYRSITVSNVMTALIEKEGKLLIFFDRLEPATDSTGQMRIGKVIRELQAELHFSPQEYKATAILMTNVVKDFEREHKTEIKEPSEKPSGLYV